MFPFEVDPGWYEIYWLSDRPQPQRRSVPATWPFAVLAALVVGGGAVLSRYHVGHGATPIRAGQRNDPAPDTCGWAGVPRSEQARRAGPACKMQDSLRRTLNSLQGRYRQDQW